MPVLPLEAVVFPDGLLGPAQPELRGRAWWVLHTRPRQEKSLARQLHVSAVPFYLPLIERRLAVRGRVLTSYVPLFPGYMFALTDQAERLSVLATRRVARILPVADQQRLWSNLRQVSRLIAAGAPITPEDRLAPGVTVEIRSGPLAGLRGKIVQGASRRRFVVEVDFIQRGASVLLDDFALAQVDCHVD